MCLSNRIKSELSQDRVVLGCMVAEMRTPAIGLILESAGLDFLIIDMEHGSFSYETASDIIVACRRLRIVPFVRVPGIDREPFQKLLDAGAMGLLVPRIETPEEVELAADLIRYAPAGSRGLSLRRAHSGFTRADPTQFTAEANRNVMLMVQIETRRGVENLDTISCVPGIDVLFVGPSDLAHSYGAEAATQVEGAIRRVMQSGRSKGIATGIHHSNAHYVAQLIQGGMRFISMNTEVGALISSLSETAAAIRSGTQGGPEHERDRR
jgi:2-keto-3-deoxy-L-rhamnonate aldolase RhmA